MERHCVSVDNLALLQIIDRVSDQFEGKVSNLYPVNQDYNAVYQLFTLGLVEIVIDPSSSRGYCKPSKKGLDALFDFEFRGIESQQQILLMNRPEK